VNRAAWQARARERVKRKARAIAAGTPTLSTLAVAMLLGPAAAALAKPACTLIVDASTGATQVRAGDGCDERQTPASSFKVPLALIGFDSGILQDENQPAWPYREEYAAWDELWKRTTTPTSWMRDSVVWYSQELTRRLGAQRFQEYVDRLDYGNRDLTGNPGRHDGLTNAWLSSSLRISASEEAAFIRRMVRRELPVSRSAIERTMAIMPTKVVDGWRISGKTGTGSRRMADGTNDRNRQVGWFVGWAERDGKTVVFARLIEDEGPEKVRAGWRARDSLFDDWPALMTRASSGGDAHERAAPIAGLDHLPLVVRDLAAATETYRRLGFSLKPGRPHENGITNAHVKFPDGSGVELITAPAGVDDLTRKYRTLAEAGEGPVFFSLHVRQPGALKAALDRGKLQYKETFVTSLVTPGLTSIFFVGDNRSPTDKPEHFAHPNGAVALARVWWAAADPLPMRRLLEALGGETKIGVVSAPARVEAPVKATVVRVENGEVVILPASHQVMPDRPIAGVTFHVRSLDATAKYFAEAGVRVDTSPDAQGARRVLIAPSEARGMYIEFREGGPASPSGR
jgi:beta-lactamase class D